MFSQTLYVLCSSLVVSNLCMIRCSQKTLYVLCSSLVVSYLCMIRCSHKPCMFCVPHWLSVISAWSDVLTNLVCSVFRIGCQLSLHDPMFSQTLYVLCSSLVVSNLCLIRCSHKPCMFCVPHWLSVISAWSDVLTNLVFSLFLIGCQLSLHDPMFSQTLYVLCSALVVSNLCMIWCSHKPCMFCVPHWLSVISAWSDVLTNLVCSLFLIGCQLSLHDLMFSQTLYVLCSSLVVSYLCMVWCSHKPCMFCVPHWLSVISAWSDVLTNLVCSVFLIGCQLSLPDPMFSQTLYVLCSALVVSYLCMIRCSHKPCMFCVPHWLSVISAWSDVLTNLVCSVFLIGCQLSLPDPMFSQTLYFLCSSLVVSYLCMIRCSHKPCMFCVPHWLSVISAWSDVLTNLVCSVFLIGCQ